MFLKKFFFDLVHGFQLGKIVSENFHILLDNLDVFWHCLIQLRS